MLQVIVFIHILAAITWLGGMLFMAMVMVPLARRDASIGFGTLRSVAKSFVPIAWVAKIVLAGTGAYLAWTYWNVRPEAFFTGDTHFLSYLQRKTGLFVVVVILSLVHDFWLGPRMMERLEVARTTGSPLPSGFGRLFVQWVARINLLLVLWIVVFAVWMTRP